MQIKLTNVAAQKSVPVENSKPEVSPEIKYGVADTPDAFDFATETMQAMNSFRQSIQDSSEEKKNSLNKLADYNQKAEKVSGYLEQLAEKSKELTEEENGSKGGRTK